MIKFSHGLLLGALLALTACGGSSHRITYSGHEESTEGVPGFVNGKRISPTVKLGQSYTVDGEEFVPRYQPDYTEEGMASWYGPGFHGGKTANGEEFDKADMTAAHRTLPLPSIVKVTMLATGKSAYVRINDRGPFAKGRIIDLSYGSAKAIGLIAKGTAKVRVEYMPAETQRFVDLLAEGREPKSIDLADEIIGHTDGVQYAGTQKRWGNPANAAPIMMSEPREISQETEDSAPVMEIASNDLPSPFAVMNPPAPASQPVAPIVARPIVAGIGEKFVQLGAFINKSNAERMRTQFSKYGSTFIADKLASDGATIHYVRMGPFSSVDQSTEMLAQLRQLGVDAKLVRE